MHDSPSANPHHLPVQITIQSVVQIQSANRCWRYPSRGLPQRNWFCVLLLWAVFEILSFRGGKHHGNSVQNSLEHRITICKHTISEQSQQDPDQISQSPLRYCGGNGKKGKRCDDAAEVSRRDDLGNGDWRLGISRYVGRQILRTGWKRTTAHTAHAAIIGEYHRICSEWKSARLHQPELAICNTVCLADYEVPTFRRLLIIFIWEHQ